MKYRYSKYIITNDGNVSEYQKNISDKINYYGGLGRRVVSINEQSTYTVIYVEQTI